MFFEPGVIMIPFSPSVASIRAPIRLPSGIHPQHVLHVPVLLEPPSGIQEDMALQVVKGTLVARGLMTHRETQ